MSGRCYPLAVINYSNLPRVRDKLDDLSTVFLLEHSNSTHTIDHGLSLLGQELTHLADLRDCEITTIDTQILSEINQYDEVCKSMRDEVKINASIRNKEVLRKRAAAQRRGSTVLRADRDFEKIIEDFEEQKNKDLKEIMLSFVQLQLKVHLEGVNRMTGIYNKLKDIDCHADAIKFRDSILEGQETDLKLAKNRSQSMGALNTLIHHPTNPFRKRSSKQEERVNRSQDGLVESVQELPRLVTNEDATEEDDDEDSEGSATEEDTDTELQPNRLTVPKMTH